MYVMLSTRQCYSDFQSLQFQTRRAMAQVSLQGSEADPTAADSEEVRGADRDGDGGLHSVHGGREG